MTGYSTTGFVEVGVRIRDVQNKGQHRYHFNWALMGHPGYTVHDLGKGHPKGRAYTNKASLLQHDINQRCCTRRQRLRLYPRTSSTPKIPSCVTPNFLCKPTGSAQPAKAGVDSAFG